MSQRTAAGTPRWLKVLGILTLVVVLLIVAALAAGLGGEHGPGRHSPALDAGEAPAMDTVATPAGDPGGHRPPGGHGEQQP
ncbi:MAG: hypothetical protein ACRDHL_01755 [Candidatus Promineifilaceae bacterium]